MRRDKVSNQLKQRHNYNSRPDCCVNCVHFTGELQEDGSYNNRCTVDAAWDNDHQEVYELSFPFGICDSHRRSG